MVDRNPELMNAMIVGDRNKVATLVQPSDLSCEEYLHGTPLHWAATQSVELVQQMLSMGADMNHQAGPFRYSPLSKAARAGRLDVVMLLVKLGAVLDVSSSLTNPLCQAASEGHYDVVKYLLSTPIDRHATYELRDGTLINALVEAELGGHSNIVQLLLSHGCSKPTDEKKGADSSKEHHLMVGGGTASDLVSFMEKRFGPVDPKRISEFLPAVPGLKVDVWCIHPNEAHQNLVLFTDGMSKMPMNVPPRGEAWRFAELVIQLPQNWIPPREAKMDEKWLWPLNWLRKLAYYPFENQSWLGQTATIVSNGEPPEPLGPNTKQTCLFLFPDFSVLSPPLQRADGSVVHFFTIVPLFTEERDFEVKYGMMPFLQKFMDSKVPMVVDITRPNFVR